MGESCELTILMPCLNEAETLAVCIDKARGFLARSGVRGEVIVADNGSTDGSQAIAREHGARVVDIPVRGYGSALRGGIAAAHGTLVIMGDSDDSYDFSRLDPFVAKLREGYDLVLGNRFAGGISTGAMPPLHRYFGNPVLTRLGRMLYRSPSKDFNCGLRGFRRDAMLALDLSAPGMEFAVEMIVKATIARLKIIEVPTTLSPDGRSRPPHLRSWRDGWRTLRFFLLLSPRALFLYPGLVLLVVGLVGFTDLIGTDVHLGRITLAEHTFVVACTAIIIGAQAIWFWVFAKVTAIRQNLLPPDPEFDRWRSVASIELGAAAGAACILLGFLGNAGALVYWGSLSFGTIQHAFLIRIVAASCMLMVLGFQTLYSVFLLYLLDYVGQKPPGSIALTAAPPPDRRPVDAHAAAPAGPDR